MLPISWLYCQTYSRREQVKYFVAYLLLLNFCTFLRGFRIAHNRKRWPVKHLTNVEINRKFSSHWIKILQKAYPMWPGVTPKMFRRFFAVYAYHYFGKSTFLNSNQSSSSLNGFASWMLGHATLDDQVIAYSSLVLNPKPKLKLFELGRNLKVQKTHKQA